MVVAGIGHILEKAATGYVGCYVVGALAPSVGIVAPPVGAGMMVAGILARDILFGSDDTKKEKRGLSASIIYLSGMVAAGMFLLEKPLVTAAVLAMAGTAAKVFLASVVGMVAIGVGVLAAVIPVGIAIGTLGFVIVTPILMIGYKLNIFPQSLHDAIDELIAKVEEEKWKKEGKHPPTEAAKKNFFCEERADRAMPKWDCGGAPILV